MIVKGVVSGYVFEVADDIGRALVKSKAVVEVAAPDTTPPPSPPAAPPKRRTTRKGRPRATGSAGDD